MSFTGTADIPSFLPDYFGSEFWDKLDAYRVHSAMFHVNGVTTPTLIQHGTRDEVASIDTMRRFRDAMVQAGNDCILLEYEGAEHAFHYPGPAGHFDDVIDATAEFLLGRLAADCVH